MNQVEILSEVSADDFPDEWYKIAMESHFWCDARLNAFMRQVQDLCIPLHETWQGLEIGCGNGVVRRQLERCTAWSIDGADIDLSALQENNTNRGRTFLYNIHDRHKDLASSYCFLLVFDVLEHIDDVEPFLDSALYHLKSGGWLFINVPAFEPLRSRYDTVAGHLRRYNKDTMQQSLQNSGLQVRDMRYWGLSMIPLLLFRKWLTNPRLPSEVVIKQGFQPPAPWINTMLLRLARLETAWIHQPVAGTSLLVAALKV